MELKKKVTDPKLSGHTTLTVHKSTMNDLRRLKELTGYSIKDLAELAVKEFAKNLVIKP